jgi:hypothetical protein
MRLQQPAAIRALFSFIDRAVVVLLVAVLLAIEAHRAVYALLVYITDAVLRVNTVSRTKLHMRKSTST